MVGEGASDIEDPDARVIWFKLESLVDAGKPEADIREVLEEFTSHDGGFTAIAELSKKQRSEKRRTFVDQFLVYAMGQDMTRDELAAAAESVMSKAAKEEWDEKVASQPEPQRRRRRRSTRRTESPPARAEADSLRRGKGQNRQ